MFLVQTLSSRPQILFVSTFRTPFIDDDLRVLSEKYDVRLAIGNGFGQAARIALNVVHVDVVFSWFASVYAGFASIVARLLGKKSVIIVGGVDVAKMPEIGYGLWISYWKSLVVRTALRHADYVCVVDESLRSELVARARYDGKNIEVLPTGYDGERWTPSGAKNPMVLTVAAIQNNARLKVKGIDILLEIAHRLPAVKFVLVGVEHEKLKGFTIPQNLDLVPSVPHEELLPFYQKAKVYFQSSRKEGLSNTLCEAMLCGCVPVATNVGGTAHAVGDSGVIVEPDRYEEMVAAIQSALAMPDQVGLRARERVIAMFPKQKRERRLQEILQEVMA